MDMEWDKDTTHTDDLDTYLPLHRLQELQQSGLIGKVSPRFYGVPTTYSQRQTRESDAPVIFSNGVKKTEWTLPSWSRFDQCATKP